MNISLASELRRFVDKKVKGGRYRDASDVVGEALRLLQRQDRFVNSRADRGTVAMPGTTDDDIEGVAFLVLMQATKDADADLRAIMEGIKAVTATKQKLRQLVAKVIRDVATNAGRRPGETLDFTQGMGSEESYHRCPMPVPDPETTGGVRFVTVDLYDSKIDMVEQLRAIEDELKGKLDSMSEIGEMTSLRLQMAMERRAKFIATLSNMLKKISRTQDTLVQNLK